MIIAIPAIVAALTPVVKAALVSAGIGAAVSGATCAVGGAVSGYHEHGELNRDVAIATVQSVPECAAEGAIVGFVVGPASVIVGPAIAPGIQLFDDAAIQVANVLDDAAKPMVNDTARPLASRVKNTAKSAAEKVSNVVRTPWIKRRHSQNTSNARQYRKLTKTDSTGNVGYVYVMEDRSTSGRYKIGKTTQPVERIRNLKSKTGLKQLDYTCIIETDDMKSLEGKLFEEFEQQRRRDLVPNTTEIFILNAAQVASACSR